MKGLIRTIKVIEGEQEQRLRWTAFAITSDNFKTQQKLLYSFAKWLAEQERTEIADMRDTMVILANGTTIKLGWVDVINSMKTFSAQYHATAAPFVAEV